MVTRSGVKVGVNVRVKIRGVVKVMGRGQCLADWGQMVGWGGLR